MLYHLTIYNAICKSLYLCVCVSVCLSSPLHVQFLHVQLFFLVFAVFSGFSHFFCVFNAFLWFFEVCCNFSRFCAVIFYIILSPGRVSCYILYIYNFIMCACVCPCVCLCVCISVNGKLCEEAG